jgi:hypothetical protein
MILDGLRNIGWGGWFKPYQTPSVRNCICLFLTKFGLSRQNFIVVSNTKLCGNSSCVSRADTYRQTDVTKRKRAFCCYANVSKKGLENFTCHYFQYCVSVCVPVLSLEWRIGATGVLKLWATKKEVNFGAREQSQALNIGSAQ